MCLCLLDIPISKFCTGHTVLWFFVGDYITIVFVFTHCCGCVFVESRWEKSVLTWRVERYSSRLSTASILGALRSAFRVWSSMTNLRFIHKSTGAVDVKVILSLGLYLVTVCKIMCRAGRRDSYASLSCSYNVNFTSLVHLLMRNCSV